MTLLGCPAHPLLHKNHENGLGHQMTSRQSELYSDDYCCPTCGLECEVIKQNRTIHSIDGKTKVVELKSYCPKCGRYFFPCS